MSNEVAKLKPRNTVCEIAEGEWEESEDTDADDVGEQGGCVEAISQSQQQQRTKTPKHLNRKYPAQTQNPTQNESKSLDKIPQSEQANQQQNFQCWNCKERGHGFFNCQKPQQEIFCYRCGRQNVVLSQCPHCQRGNCQQNAQNREIAHSKPISTTKSFQQTQTVQSFQTRQ